MAIVSKTDRDGIDIVIEELQQSTFPKLLGFWDPLTTYTSFPRANKNLVDGSVVPQVSADQKDYEQVLTNDKVFINSFFLIDDVRNYDEELRQIKQNISIIFQADLKKLYGQTNRADEQFNMDVLRVFQKENVFIVGDIELTEGIDNVYSDLSITGKLKEIVDLHDMSQLHVLKLSFDVLYRPDCPPNIKLVCSPCSETFNGAAITPAASGGTKSIIVQNDLPSPVQVGVALIDTAGNLLISVPAGAGAAVSTSPLSTGQENTFLPGDDGDRFLNGDYATVNVADISDFYTLVEDNEWGHKHRISSDNGGFMDEATGNFFDKDGIATTKALAFPNDIMRDYAWRRRWFLNRSGSRNWDDSVTLAQTDSRGGEVGWFLPNRAEYESLSSENINSPTYIDSRLFNWSAFNMWCSTTRKTGTTSAHRYTSSVDFWNTATKTQANGGAYIKLF